MIKFFSKNKWSILFTLVIGIVVFLPIMINGNNFLIINNDTAAHLKVFESLKNSENVSTSYLGQKIIWYCLIGIEKVSGINIDVLFMIFNFACLYVGGLLVSLMVYLLTRNKIASLFSLPVIIFGIGSVQHLFKSGTIFNLVEYLILLPLLIIVVYLWWKSIRVNFMITLLMSSILVFFISLISVFHPSFFGGLEYIGKTGLVNESSISIPETLFTFFGFANFIALLICGYLWVKNKITWNIRTVIIGFLFICSLVMEILSVFGLTPFSSRLVINVCLVIGIVLCILTGIVLNERNNKFINMSIIALLIIGIVPNLIEWFSWESLYNSDRGLF